MPIMFLERESLYSTNLTLLMSPVGQNDPHQVKQHRSYGTNEMIHETSLWLSFPGPILTQYCTEKYGALLSKSILRVFTGEWKAILSEAIWCHPPFIMTEEN